MMGAMSLVAAFAIAIVIVAMPARALIKRIIDAR